MSNFRPIPVISVVGQIMEKLVHNTVTALPDITNRWYQNIDVGKLNGVIFLDLKRHSTLSIMISYYKTWIFTA
jgi:hypothetical protein